MPAAQDLNELMSLLTSSEAKMTKEEGRLVLEDIRSIEVAFHELGINFHSELMREIFAEGKDQIFAALKTLKAMILVGADLA